MNQFAENTSCQCNQNKQEAGEEKSILKARITAKAIPSTLLSILIAFFPKCPFCWAVYMSMFGGMGLAKVPYMSWLLPVLVVFLGVHLFILFKRSSHQGYLPFVLSLTGSMVILGGRSLFPVEKWLLVMGLILIASGSLLNNFLYIRLTTLFNK